MPKPNDRNSGPIKISERDISGACIEYLQLRGWHCLRQNAGPYGQTGVPDFLAIHYRKKAAMWLEMKRPGAKMTCRCAGKRRGKKCTMCSQAAFAGEVAGMGGTVLRVDDVGAFIRDYEITYGREGQLRLGEGA